MNDDHSDYSSPVKKQPEEPKPKVKPIEPIKPLAQAPISRPNLAPKKEAPRFDYLKYGKSESDQSEKYSEVEEDKTDNIDHQNTFGG